MIGHDGLLRAFSFACPIRGSTPRHAQTAGDLGFAVQFNAETPWHFAQVFTTGSSRASFEFFSFFNLYLSVWNIMRENKFLKYF